MNKSTATAEAQSHEAEAEPVNKDGHKTENA